jgi:hypothetical protein
VLAAWRHLIELTLEDARFNERVLGPELLSHFEVELSARRAQGARSSKAALFVVPHVGMWEAMPPSAPRSVSGPTYVVSRPPRNRPLSRFAQRVREARGYRLIPRHGAVEGTGQGGGGGGYVGLMLDQRARGKTLVAPFFGRAAHCERAIPVLVRALEEAGRVRAPATATERPVPLPHGRSRACCSRKSFRTLARGHRGRDQPRDGTYDPRRAGAVLLAATTATAKPQADRSM